jgi:hypothetical protein
MSERKGSETSQAGKGKRETRRGVEVGAKEEAEEDEEDGDDRADKLECRGHIRTI